VIGAFKITDDAISYKQARTNDRCGLQRYLQSVNVPLSTTIDNI